MDKTLKTCNHVLYILEWNFRSSASAWHTILGLLMCMPTVSAVVKHLESNINPVLAACRSP